MRLKKIRLAGFKSFVDPTNIPFPGDMTAIVGPNGCGKSNVIDAVRWVLGESSAKNLRGDAMTDVIFNGSSARKAVSQCSVELVFDNSENRIQGEFAAFNEISVKRVVTKEAVSSYFLNSGKCRRKDITDLFLGTGLGPRSYAIIEQGMISRLIESKPQELRVFIEEAAGISKYKERRKETQNRISHTKDNLERLDDVCQELDEQISKLKRQASAANKYKELKEQERELKGELIAIRYLAQADVMQQCEQQINTLNEELEQLLVSQQSDESGLQELKTQQLLCKREIDDEQQSIFKLGTEITKLEQSQLFSEKRAAQIESEIELLEHTSTEAETALVALQAELGTAQAVLIEKEPEKEILEEQLYELETKTLEIDEKVDQFKQKSKSSDDDYYQKNQLLQQKHGQIQQTLSLQARTETRINELSDELAEFNQEELDQQVTDTEKAVSALEKEHKQSSEALNSLQQQLVEKTDRLNQTTAEHSEFAQKHTQDEAKLLALEALQSQQKSQSDHSQKMPVEESELWDVLQVKSGGENILLAIFAHLQQATILATSANDYLDWHLQHDKTSPNHFFNNSFVTKKRSGSAAELVENDAFPCVLNQFVLLDDASSAASRLASLQANEYLIDTSGVIWGQDFVCAPNQQQESDNVFLRANQIKELKASLEDLSTKLAALSARKQEQGASVSETQQKVTAANENVQQLSLAQQQKAMQLDNLRAQQSQLSARLTKLNNELHEQRELMQQETLGLEMLNEEVEDLSEQVLELESARQQAESDLQQLVQQQQTLQAQTRQCQQQVHQHAMQVQQQRNSIQIIQEQVKAKQQVSHDNQDKMALLKVEAQDLLAPKEAQQEKLQSILQTQSEKREALQTKQAKLSDIDLQINDIEKGYQGVQSKIDGLKEQIQSQQMQAQSAQVRGQTHLEQLSETKQSLKDILENLSDDAQEDKWQSDLDKVQAGISRLGAVNLAAVDEFEEQSARKEKLNAQHLDLSEALETLENAMRKIDKETRSRFKDTFDRVNNDLKQLFPKVFGGGMAYLDLTDDDLLDTGVTIMARPPGKKNSTIQLLSGGEKALTALSLVFAIFRLNPAPFCLLDEVDAPLDDANVGRFCRLVSQMSESVQFIYITHNKVAMEMATHLTGVTMAEPGVSRMVAVDMEQALAIAE